MEDGTADLIDPYYSKAPTLPYNSMGPDYCPLNRLLRLSNCRGLHRTILLGKLPVGRLGGRAF